jgi:archaellum component FlaG (FlaF/FlaG flagellin family)
VIAGTTFAIGAGAPSTTIVVNGQTISVGSGGLGFSDTTISPPSLPTNVVVLDGELITAIGASQVVIDGSTILYGPGSTPQTKLFNGQLITIGPDGVVFGTSTIGGAAGITLGLVGGVTVTEVGYSLAVIGGITYTIGPNAQPITTMINGKPVTIGPSGLIVDDSTLTYPLNHLPATQVITAGGITYSQIGSTLVNIGGTIYTIGPDAKTTTQVYNGQTISLGPGGVGFKTTTVAVLSAPTATQTGKKNGAGAVQPLYGVLGICIAFGVG